jgi:hypothetical protein
VGVVVDGVAAAEADSVFVKGLAAIGGRAGGGGATDRVTSRHQRTAPALGLLLR